MSQINSIKSKMWQGTLVYTPFKLLAYSSEQIYLPLFINSSTTLYHSLNMDPTLLHISVQKKLQYLFIMLFLYMWQQQINPSNTKCKQHVQITGCASMGKVCQYVCHMQSLAWTIWPGGMSTYNNDDDNDSMFWLHRLH